MAQRRSLLYYWKAKEPRFDSACSVDLQMPVMNGIEAIVAIRQEFPNARFIVLTTYDGDVQALRALKAGATGYLLKGMLREELVDAIRAIHACRR